MCVSKEEDYFHQHPRPHPPCSVKCLKICLSNLYVYIWMNGETKSYRKQNYLMVKLLQLKKLKCPRRDTGNLALHWSHMSHCILIFRIDLIRILSELHCTIINDLECITLYFCSMRSRSYFGYISAIFCVPFVLLRTPVYIKRKAIFTSLHSFC